MRTLGEIRTPPSKNRVWNFFGETHSRTSVSWSQVVEPHREINPDATTTAQDVEYTALYYYGYRFYDSELGRWISRDPIGETGGLCVYGAMQNNLVGQHDILGLACPCKIDSFSITFQRWLGAWPSVIGTYRKQLWVKFRLVLKAPATKEDCKIEQYMLGEVNGAVKGKDILDANGFLIGHDWMYDRPNMTKPLWHPESKWGIGGKHDWSDDGRTATWEDKPGLAGLRKKDFPIYWGGVGKAGYFKFKTVVSSFDPAGDQRTLRWGMLIDYVTPTNGKHYFYQ